MLERRDEIKDISGLRGAKSIAAKLSDAEEVLLLSQKLVSLDFAVEPYNTFAVPDDLYWRGASDEELQPLFEELEFNSLLAAIQLVESKRGLDPDASTDAGEVVESEYSLLNKQSYPAFLKELQQQKEFAFDTETSSLDVTACELLGISFSWKAGQAFYLPVKGKDVDACFSLDDIRQDLAEIFANPKVLKVGLNLKYDAAVLLQHGFELAGLHFDIMLASHLLQPDGGEHGLKALALRHLGEEMLSYKELVEGVEKLEDVELERVSKYACHDADASWKLYKVFAKKLDEVPELKSAFEVIEMPLVLVLAQIELAGIKIDVPFLERLGAEFSEEAEILRAKAMELAGQEFNVNSTQQLAEILFVKLGIPTKGVKKTKTGFSTNASVLSKLAPQHEIAQVLLDYREIHKLNSTYVEALQRLAKDDSARVHSSFNQAIAATGRLTSSDPNLQNIPIRNPRGRRIRSAFIAEEGYQLIAADYSQIELRVLAHMSGDENMIAAFNDDVDIHSRTAEQIFGAILGDDAEKSRLRRIAKTINFGIVYGVSAFRLATDIGVTRARAQEYIDDYFARYPKIRSYYEDLESDLDELGYVETMFGRRRFLKGLNMQGRDAGYALRSMLNAPIQGTAAEIIKRAMVKLHERLSSNNCNARIILQVHDELVVEVKDESSEEVIDIVRDEMESAISLSVPLKVDLRCSKRWGDAV
ncbi:UNVERIFIED_CONTAM: hypothetical protein GTU68_044173 [Idotea baltica]|nr:hypothetical protein [Idotea baltica]